MPQPTRDISRLGFSSLQHDSEVVHRFIGALQLAVLTLPTQAVVARAQHILNSDDMPAGPLGRLMIKELLIRLLARPDHRHSNGRAQLLSTIAVVNPYAEDCISQLRAVLNTFDAVSGEGYPRGLRIRMLIKAACDNPQLNLREAATYVGLSTSRAAHLLKEETGRSFSELLREARVNTAKELLVTSTLSIKEIAARVGYSSTTLLDRHFRRDIGCSPGQYRDSHRTR